MRDRESRRIEETTMTIDIDPETGRRILPPVPHVFTATRMFGPDVAHHVVPIAVADLDRLRLFERRIGGDLGRHFDRTNDLLHTSQTKSDFDRFRFDDGEPVPTHEHESFDAYLKAIGYSWSRNAYRAIPDALPLAA
jgi:hypothetical protein